MGLGWKDVVTGENPEIIADLGSDVLIARFSGAPVSGAGGTLAEKAGPASMLFRIDTPGIYVNTGTKAAPTWSQVTVA